MGDPHLVFAVRQPPFPPTHGAAIRTHRLVTGLARAFPVTLVTFEHVAGAEGHLPAAEVAARLPDVEVVTVPGLGADKRRQQLRSLAWSRSWQWGRYAVPAYDARLRQVAQARRAAIVHFDDPGVGRFGPLPGTLSALAPHNVEHRILRGTAESESGARGAFAALEWRKTRQEERRAWRAMPLCVAVSEVDARAMREGGAQRVVICPNGADPVEPLPAPRRSQGEPLRLLFVGTANYGPYERGLAWFVEEVLARLRGTLDVRLDVVGSPPDRPVKAPDVSYHGRVPSVDDWYARAHVVVVPVFHGSGTRLKIVEAMAHGRPVLTTPLGAEGLPIAAGHHYITASGAEEFGSALRDLDDRLGPGGQGVDELLAAARAAVTPLFWPNVVAGLAESYREHAGRAPD